MSRFKSLRPNEELRQKRSRYDKYRGEESVSREVERVGDVGLKNSKDAFVAQGSWHEDQDTGNEHDFDGEP